MESSIFAKKTAMLIYDLEQCLGSYVRKCHSSNPAIENEGALKKIIDREGLNPRSDLRSKVNKSISASYFEEILNLAIAVSVGTSDHHYLLELEVLLKKEDAFTIRNTISHANRDFPRCYWYRIASIASHPIVEKLGFYELIESLYAAEEGKLAIPPDAWLEYRNSSIPNNLPGEFEHEVTGLIGRNRDKAEFLRCLCGGRYHLLSIVAPGGLGKTALVLDALRDCTLDFDSKEWCDSILFVTMKQESLSASGLNSEASARTIEELKAELAEALRNTYPQKDFDDLQEAKTQLQNERIVLCVDNLETLLRDSPECFEEFYDNLPDKWRVVVTSRIEVNGAKSIRLKQLEPEGAKALVYKYSNSLGIQAPSNEVVSDIVESSRCNPLAIRLIIDRFNLGYCLANAKHTTTKDIVNFSYSNLVDTLDPNSIKVLECLFIKSELARGDIIEYVGIGVDETVESIRKLTSTSLAFRDVEGDEEFITIGQSIRELLRENPVDLNARKEIQKRMDRQLKTIKLHKNIQRTNYSKFSEDYIPTDIPENLSAGLIRSIKILRTKNPPHNQVIESLDRLQGLISMNQDSVAGHLTLARLFQLAQDAVTAEKHFTIASQLEKDRPTARILFINHLLVRQKSDEAHTLAETLLREGWDNISKSDIMTAQRIVSCVFRAFADMHMHERVIELAKKYRTIKELEDQANLSLASAIISKASQLHSSNPPEALSMLVEAGNYLNSKKDVIYKTNLRCKTFRVYIKELKHLIEIIDSDMVKKELITDSLTIANDLFEEAFERTSADYFKDEVIPIIRIFSGAISDERNPFFRLSRWRQFVSNEVDLGELEESLVAEGYKIYSVYKIPHNPKSELLFYVFARNVDGERVFVHKNQCKNENKWEGLETGHLVACRDIKPPEGKNSFPVPRDVVII